MDINGEIIFKKVKYLSGNAVFLNANDGLELSPAVSPILSVSFRLNIYLNQY